jgi:hypothetical protein
MSGERVFGILAVTSPGVVDRGLIAIAEHLIATQLAAVSCGREAPIRAIP